MEKIIRMFNMGTEIYLNRDDVLALIKDQRKRADSLNAKNELDCLIKALSEGIEDHKGGI
jgi:hypothetical protein